MNTNKEAINSVLGIDPLIKHETNFQLLLKLEIWSHNKHWVLMYWNSITLNVNFKIKKTQLNQSTSTWRYSDVSENIWEAKLLRLGSCGSKASKLLVLVDKVGPLFGELWLLNSPLASSKSGNLVLILKALVDLSVVQ